MQIKSPKGGIFIHMYAKIELYHYTVYNSRLEKVSTTSLELDLDPLLHWDTFYACASPFLPYTCFHSASKGTVLILSLMLKAMAIYSKSKSLTEQFLHII